MTKQEDLLNSNVPETKQLHEGNVKEQGQVTVGQMLRAAREEQGIDLGLLASSLKVSIRQLELLESDQYDSLPDMAFTRNFAISVAKRLKVDTKQITERLPRMDNTSTSHAVTRLAHDARGAVMKDEILPRRKRSGFWWLLLIGLVAVLIGLLFLLPQWGSGRLSEGNRAIENVGGTSVPVQVTPLRMQSTPTEVQREVIMPSNPSMVPSPSVSETSPSGSTTDIVDNTSLVEGEESAPDPEAVNGTEQQDMAPVAVLSETDNKLEVKTRSESWLRVTAASGKTLYQNILKEGAIYSLLLVPEELPLSVRIGRANDAVVTVRGTVMNLSSYIVGDVADFKVE